MPNAPIPADVMSAVWEYSTGTGHQCRNILWYQGDFSGLVQADLDNYSSRLGSHLTDRLSTHSTYLGCKFYFGTGGADPNVGVSVAGAGSGGRGDSMSPPAVQVLLKKLTGVGGRHNRGRMYLPDVREEDVDNDGFLTDAARADYQEFCDQVVDPINTALTDLSWILYDQIHGVAHAPITAFNCEQRVATQRRRFKR